MNKILGVLEILKQLELKNDELISIIDSSLDMNNIDVGQRYLSADIIKIISNSQNELISAKTGSGKSYSIREVAKRRMSLGLKTFIIVPNKQLINEYKNKLVKHNPITFLNDDMVRDGLIFILTQERFNLYFKKNMDKYLEQAREWILIIDEAQNIFPTRGNIRWNNKTKSPQFQNKSDLERETHLLNTLRMGLMNFKSVKALMPYFSDAYANKFSGIFNINTFKYDVTSRTQFTIKGLSKDNPLWSQNIKEGRLEQQNNKAFKNWNEHVSCDIASDFMKKKVLFYASKREIYGNAPQKKKAIQKTTLKDIVDKIDNYFGRENILTNYLSNGYGVITGDVPIWIRSEIQSLLNSGDIQFIVANTTVMQGLNLDVEYMLFNNISPRTEKSSTLYTSAANLMGRVGRSHKDDRNIRHGKIIFKVSDGENYKEAAIVKAFEKASRNDIEEDLSVVKNQNKKQKLVLRETIHSIDEKVLDKLGQLTSPITKDSIKNIVEGVTIESKNTSYKIGFSISKHKGYEVAKTCSKRITKILNNNKVVSINQIKLIKNELQESFKLYKSQIYWESKDTPDYLIIEQFLNRCSEYESDLYDDAQKYKVHDEINIIYRTPSDTYFSTLVKGAN